MKMTLRQLKTIIKEALLDAPPIIDRATYQPNKTSPFYYNKTSEPKSETSKKPRFALEVFGENGEFPSLYSTYEAANAVANELRPKGYICHVKSIKDIGEGFYEVRALRRAKNELSADEAIKNLTENSRAKAKWTLAKIKGKEREALELRKHGKTSAADEAQQWAEDARHNLLTGDDTDERLEDLLSPSVGIFGGYYGD